MNAIIHIIAESKWNLLIKIQSYKFNLVIENNKGDPKFEVDDNVKILKYKKYCSVDIWS